MSSISTTATVWFARTGPCWCTGRPGAAASRDLERLRRLTIPRSSLLDRDLVVTPDRLTPTLAPAIRSLIARAEVITVAYPLCPAAGPAMPVDLVDTFTDGRVPQIVLDDCVSGRPELLVVALLEHLGSAHAPSPSPRFVAVS